MRTDWVVVMTAAVLFGVFSILGSWTVPFIVGGAYYLGRWDESSGARYRR